MRFLSSFTPRTTTLALALAASLALAGCKEQPQMNPGMPEVSVVTVQPQRAPVVTELPGRIDAVRNAEVRARVTGIVQKIEFEQGGDVKKGQRLFKIDPAPMKAAYDQAAAQLKQAQADLYTARQLANRYEPLVKANAVSKQEYDNAVGSARQADAAVAAARAALDNAKINLNYTDVDSPIDGRIGKPLVTEGALVEAGTATQMALVQQLNPVYVDFNQSTADLAQLRRAFAEGQLQKIGADAARVTVVLDDGTEYAHPGKLLFTGMSVDPGTGQVNVRAEVENPDDILLPGMFVRVRFEQGVNEKALLVPQQALQRTPDGRQSLMVLRDGKVAQISVVTGPVVGARTIISQGLNPGDQVVVEGFQKIRPGAPAKPTEWQPKGEQQGQQPGQQPGQAPGAQPSQAEQPPKQSS
ncbi:efflux RND transporter periplasmic adaptor subunit [Orrella dioscoreae]|uniref:efflux RND transporter periplasmic adaptor subunit n=1 Tax=Orrella dioscoreae TaxID=1851544 RepID=UPI0008335603